MKISWDLWEKLKTEVFLLHARVALIEGLSHLDWHKMQSLLVTLMMPSLKDTGSYKSIGS